MSTGATTKTQGGDASAKASSGGNWMQALQNPQAQYVRKFLFEILQDKYSPYQDIIERVSHSLVTRQDIDSFGKLILAVFEKGYLKAINDNREALRQRGIEVVEKREQYPPQPQSQQPTIFGNNANCQNANCRNPG